MSEVQRAGTDGLGQDALARGHESGLSRPGKRAWAKELGPEGLGQRAWNRGSVPGSLSLGQGQRSRSPRPEDSSKPRRGDVL